MRCDQEVLGNLKERREKKTRVDGLLHSSNQDRDDVHYSLVTAYMRPHQSQLGLLKKLPGTHMPMPNGGGGGGGGGGMNEIKEKSDHAPTVTART